MHAVAALDHTTRSIADAAAGGERDAYARRCDSAGIRHCASRAIDQHAAEEAFNKTARGVFNAAARAEIDASAARHISDRAGICHRPGCAENANGVSKRGAL